MRIIGRLAGAVLFFSAPVLMAGVVLQPAPAPEWEVSEWLNGDPGSLRDHRGRVVVIGFVQLSCPASREFAIPLLQRWHALYGDREEVVTILIHSAFASHDLSPARLQEFTRENGILLPLGLDAYDDEDEPVPVTTRRFEAGGTPHLVIVDRDGMLRFTHFGTFATEPLEGFIERLLQEAPGTINRIFETAPSAERVRPTVDARLSGTYVFQTERATGACADWVPAAEVLAELRVYRDAIDIDFVEPLLGIPAMETSYDAATGRVEWEGRRVVATRGDDTGSRVMRLEGVLDDDAQPPELEFGLSFLGGKCAVEGRARGEP
jgi:hypothetical protein